MSDKKIEEIATMIVKEAEKEAEKILNDARRKAENIIKEAEEQLEKSIKQQVGQMFTTIGGEEIRRKIAEVKLEAKRKILAVKEEAIKTVLEAAVEKLKEIAESESYPKIIEKLVYEAGKVLGGGELIIALSKKDKDIKLNWKQMAKKIEQELGVKTVIKEVDANLDCIGGVVVKSADGKFTFDNTFKERINRLERRLRIIIAKRLFW